MIRKNGFPQKAIIIMLSILFVICSLQTMRIINLNKEIERYKAKSDNNYLMEVVREDSTKDLIETLTEIRDSLKENREYEEVKRLVSQANEESHRWKHQMMQIVHLSDDNSKALNGRFAIRSYYLYRFSTQRQEDVFIDIHSVHTENFLSSIEYIETNDKSSKEVKLEIKLKLLEALDSIIKNISEIDEALDITKARIESRGGIVRDNKLEYIKNSLLKKLEMNFNELSNLEDEYIDNVTKLVKSNN